MTGGICNSRPRSSSEFSNKEVAGPLTGTRRLLIFFPQPVNLLTCGTLGESTFPLEFMVDRRIAQYHLLQKLGAGAMGEIYQAQDTRLNRIVAIKALPGAHSGDADRRRRFIQEAQAASALNHPNIVTVHDIISDGDSELIVMEYITGKTLSDLIPGSGMPVAQVLRYAVQMADALEAAHAAGIIHRDLKPGNIMVTAADRVKILDFGLAKFSTGATFRDSDETWAAGAAPLTVEGSILGTVSYMSPEQAEGKPVDVRSDIFSFGAVLYEMVTGARAFKGESALSTLTAILRDDARPMAELAPGVPAKLDAMIRRCLQKRPDDRWQSMGELRAALERLKQESDSGALYLPVPPASPAAPSAPPEKSSKMMIAILFGVLVVCVAGIGLWSWATRRPTIPPASSPVPEMPAASQADRSRPSPLPPTPAPAAAVAPKIATPDVPVAIQPEVTTERVQVTDGLPIALKLTDDIPSDAQPGRPLRFTVASDVHVGDSVVLAKGAVVTGEIAGAGKKKFLGMGGKATFRLMNATAADGHPLQLRSTPKGGEGQGRRPVDAGSRKRGKDLLADAGTDYVAYVDGDQSVMIRK
jgi:serine/threonine protein kinase